MGYPVVLTDDFAGASDTGLSFVRAGLRVAIVTALVDLDRLPTAVDVVVLDTETRNVPDTEAGTSLLRISEELKARRLKLLYKKIDSTLRGPIGAELDAITTGYGCSMVIVAAAFPEAGRTTVGGYQLIHGVPVDRGEMAQDLGSPVISAYLPDQVGGSEQKTALITLRELAGTPEMLGCRLEALMDQGIERVVMDAVSEQDLQVIARAAATLASPPLLCGTAGLARWLARAFGLQVQGTRTPLPAPEQSHKGILVVAGSRSQVTREQVTRLVARFSALVQAIDPGEICDPQRRQPVLSHCAERICEALQEGRPVVSTLRSQVDWQALQNRYGLAGEQLIRCITRGLGELARRVSERSRPAGLVVSGGDTAYATLQAMGGWGALVETAIQPGVAVLQLLGGPYQGLRLVVKGGAIGSPDALEEAITFLQPEDRTSSSPKPAQAATRPILGITMGDPNGIGPEIIVKALSQDPQLYAWCRPLVIGHDGVLARNLGFAQGPVQIHPIQQVAEARFKPGTIEVLSPEPLDVARLTPGTLSREAGRASARWVIHAVELALAGTIEGIVTAPINKEAINLAGYHYPGHTELLATLTRTRDYRLTLFTEGFLVSHVTTHVALHQAIALLSIPRIVKTIALLGRALEQMGKSKPRIAVAGLNPHAGEGGLFGDEEQTTIIPALSRAASYGWELIGPVPPDTLFFRARRGEFDGVVAMYHDQGHIPVKMLFLDRSVNVSLGLPIVRTSVDHGTAFDIAGQGIARPDSLLEALRVAAQLARQHR